MALRPGNTPRIELAATARFPCAPCVGVTKMGSCDESPGYADDGRTILSLNFVRSVVEPMLSIQARGVRQTVIL